MTARPVFDRPLRRDPILVVWALLNLVLGLVALNRHTTWSGSVEGWRVAAVLSDVATMGMTSYLFLALLPALLRWWWRRHRVSQAAATRQRNWSGSRTLHGRDQLAPVVGPRLPDPWGSHRARGTGQSSVTPSDAGTRRRAGGAWTTLFRTSGPPPGGDPAEHPSQGHSGAPQTSPLAATNGGAGLRRRTTAETPDSPGERSPLSEADGSAAQVLSDPQIEFVPWSQTTLRGPGRWRVRRAAPEPTFRRVLLPQGPAIAGQPTRVGLGCAPRHLGDHQRLPRLSAPGVSRRCPGRHGPVLSHSRGGAVGRAGIDGPRAADTPTDAPASPTTRTGYDSQRGRRPV